MATIKMEEIKSSPKRSIQHEEQGSKRICLDDQVEMRFLIASKEAGAIIGKSGSNINSLRKNFKSRVSITASPGPERVLSINVVRDEVEPILRELIKFLEEKHDRNEIELRLLVHTNNAGVIIGKSGAKIKELKKETDCTLKVFPSCCPNSTERICMVQGSSESVLNGLKAILDLVLPLAARRSSNCRYYDPYDYDQSMIMQYGGYPLDSGSQLPFKKPKLPGGPMGGFDQMPHPGPGGPVNWEAKPSHPMMMQSGQMMMNWPPYNEASGAKKPGNFYKWPNSGNEYYDVYGQNMGYSGSNYNMGAMGGASGMQPTAYPDSYVPPFDGPSHGKELDGAIPDIRFNPDGSAYFTIPNKLVGAIIGKSGSRIRCIRYESGAEVQIENIKDANGQHRTVTVKGNEKQIQQACLLLQKSLYDHANELA